MLLFLPWFVILIIIIMYMSKDEDNCFLHGEGENEELKNQ